METINTINLVEEYGNLLKENERLQKAFTDLSFKAYAGMEEKDRENERLRGILRDVLEQIPEHIPLGTMRDICSIFKKDSE